MSINLQNEILINLFTILNITINLNKISSNYHCIVFRMFDRNYSYRTNDSNMKIVCLQIIKFFLDIWSHLKLNRFKLILLYRYKNLRIYVIIFLAWYDFSAAFYLVFDFRYKNFGNQHLKFFEGLKYPGKKISIYI